MLSTMSTKLTYEDVAQLLHYDPETGVITWRVSRGPVLAGAEAGWADAGRRRIEILGHKFWAHRVAWLLHYREWPSTHLDHINGVANDNRIANLREATLAQNAQNRKRNKNNTSGHTGVYWSVGQKVWVAMLCVNSRLKHLGCYAEKQAAIDAHAAAKAKHHTFHPQVNQR